MWSKQFRRHYRLSDVHFDCLVSVTQSANTIHAILLATETEEDTIRTILCEISLYPFMNHKAKCGTHFLLSAHAIPAERLFVLIITASHAFSSISFPFALCFTRWFPSIFHAFSITLKLMLIWIWTDTNCKEIFHLASRINYKQYI